MKVEISVPTTLGDITLGQYQKFVKLQEQEDIEESFLVHKTIEIFCGIDLKDTLRLKFNYVTDLMGRINKIFETTPKLKETFTMDGVEYGFIPDLDDMSFGEYVDLDTNYGDWDNMHKAMAILYRPIVLKKNNRYVIEEYEGTRGSEKFKQAPLDVVLGCHSFFLRLNQELLTVTLDYLKREAPTTLDTQELEALGANGDIISLSMHSLKEIYNNLKK